MKRFREILATKALRNASASYVAFVSTTLYALVSIPIAVKYLSQDDIGLWLIVNGIVGYLLWMDAGIGDATGRKIADAFAKGDQEEINRWWSASIGVLVTLGVITALAALALAQFLPDWLEIENAKRADAIWLFAGGGLMAALGTPMRAYPGILLAQHRFHWVSIVQAIIPWVQLLAFYILVRLGYGVRSYLPSLAISQAAGWGIWLVVVHGGNVRFRFAREGLDRSRIGSLFSFGGSIAVMGLVAAVLSSLPSMLLAKAGGLALVPVYAFTMRGVSMFAQLSYRTTHAFYPGMQRLFVAGNMAEFSRRYQTVMGASVAIGLATGGIALAFNPALIAWLASPEYFAGPWANFWFAVGLVIGGICGGFTNLLQISGNMGKMAMIAPLQLAIGIVTGWFALQWYGLAGLAAVFSIGPPLCKGIYALWRGARNCGYDPMRIGGRTLLLATLGCLVLWAGALLLDHPSLPPLASFQFMGRILVLPSLGDVIVGIGLAAIGATLAAFLVRGFRHPINQIAQR